MATENEIRVMRLLSAIEVPLDAANIIESWGTEAVTVTCEAALGTYVGLRPKIRTNAAAVVGKMEHPQARETHRMLITDESPGVAIRALRAAARRRDDALTGLIGTVIRRPATDPLVAVEAVRALREIDSPAARKELADYVKASNDRLPHRSSAVVRKTLETGRTR
jgi:HEAT repeat protein